MSNIVPFRQPGQRPPAEPPKAEIEKAQDQLAKVFSLLPSRNQLDFLSHINPEPPKK